MNRINPISLFVGVLAMTLVASCSKDKSSITGWNYNDTRNGGFEKTTLTEQAVGPGLILIEGGTFTMGRVEQDVTFDWDNIPRRITVSSFYIDETEISNIDWNEYLYWLNRVYGIDYPEVYKKALPDTLVWRSKLAYNEPYVDYYLRHPAFRDYPVVGINWLQANDFCTWRTDRVNEQILIDEGLFEHNPQQLNEDHFTTEAYLAGQYESGKRVDGLKSLDPNIEFRNVKIEDGILLPKYRLPTEAEWEYAAYGLRENSVDERVIGRKLYPWNGHWVRNPKPNYIGDMMANFVRGRGDYMGVAGSLNDNASITSPVYSYWPNDYGLYNMAGNVSEWVLDVYRPLTGEDENGLNPYRGNIFETKILNSEGGIDDKFDIVIYDIPEVKKYLVEYKKRKEKNAPYPEEIDLLDDIIGLTDRAIELEAKRQPDEANLKIQDAVDLIKDSDLGLSPILLKGISDFVTNRPGQIKYREVTPEENINRLNYTFADNIDYLDGDIESTIYYDNPEDENATMYAYGATSLINDRARVYKGGSWKDRAYYMNPGTRRFLDERQSTATIGFRCAMIRIGSPLGF